MVEWPDQLRVLAYRYQPLRDEDEIGAFVRGSPSQSK